MGVFLIVTGAFSNHLPLDWLVEARSIGTSSTIEHGIRIAKKTGAKMYSGVERRGRYLRIRRSVNRQQDAKRAAGKAADMIAGCGERGKKKKKKYKFILRCVRQDAGEVETGYLFFFGFFFLMFSRNGEAGC